MSTIHQHYLPSAISCSIHKEEKLSHWCETCQKSLCKSCPSLHNSHTLKDIDMIYGRIPPKSSLEAQLENHPGHKQNLLDQYEMLNCIAIPTLQDLKDEQMSLFLRAKNGLEDALVKIRSVYESRNENPEFHLFDPKSECNMSKFRVEDSSKQIEIEISNLEGFLICIEPYYDESFSKVYMDAYTNRTKDFAMTNILADKLLRKYPLNLQALALKAEAREGHEGFRAIVTQPVYDEYDQFAIAESYLFLKHKEEAYSLYLSSSAKGCMYSQHKLGTIYFNGDPELKIPQNKKEALTYFLSAANKGLALSQYNIGYCYYLGDGVPKDKGKAVQFYRLAAEQGYAVAEYKLGHCYENGIGLEEDFESAEKWYKRAAQKGHDGAMSALDLLVSKMHHEREEKEKTEREEKERQANLQKKPQKGGWFGLKK